MPAAISLASLLPRATVALGYSTPLRTANAIKLSAMASAKVPKLRMSLPPAHLIHGANGGEQAVISTAAKNRCGHRSK
jgi:hypothetical protein